MRFATMGARIAALLCALCVTGVGHAAADAPQERVRQAVDAAIRPMMAKDRIPGVAVGVIVDGSAQVFNYGVASTQSRQPVTDATLFELGSVSKTFTATLTAWAQVDGQLSLGDDVGKYLPALHGTPFGKLSLLNLGTHTPGVLPLQVPDDIHDDAQLMRYFKAWRPTYAPGTVRTYTNPGIGALGLIAAKSMGQDFTVLVEQRLFPALELKNSFIDVPDGRKADYAQGYTRDGKPIRMAGGVLAAQAYGVKSTAADMLRFIEANMKLVRLDSDLQRAITQTHTGYFQAGPMTQDLIWEQYPYPVTLNALLEGNAPSMALDATPVKSIEPPAAPRENVWINKTGSTNGFGSYVAFVPARHIGIVILGNRNFPIADRVAAAHRILMSLDGQ
ncbi:beta-lactamase [Paraburkholderia sp. Tr-20389]|uniref:class C beta-lactamase n=1 Tax=Paraburkholderia sp. Tr-20389 TaxID=2703903 RepID=UPI00197F00AD|nr:class C beta-lactamase [Paraburkholderia sp. Tr-20389]MBN3758068.1 beta-lactamase [Paraburkholderia sp. Tr-20389]